MHPSRPCGPTCPCGRFRPAIAAALALSIALAGCGASAAQTNALEIAALVASTAGGAVEGAAHADARASCPAGGDECMDAIVARWAPVDGAYAAVRAALGAWYLASVIAARAGADPLAAMLEAAADFASVYADLARAAGGLGLELPRLPVTPP